jgi:hypothetical protein
MLVPATDRAGNLAYFITRVRNISAPRATVPYGWEEDGHDVRPDIIVCGYSTTNAHGCSVITGAATPANYCGKLGDAEWATGSNQLARVNGPGHVAVRCMPSQCCLPYAVLGRVGWQRAGEGGKQSDANKQGNEQESSASRRGESEECLWSEVYVQASLARLS